MIDPILKAIRHLLSSESFGCRVALVTGPDAFASAVLDVSGNVLAGGIPGQYAEQIVADAGKLMAVERSATLRYDNTEAYFEVIAPRPRLLIFGAVHIAQAMLPMARSLGFTVSISDARAAFISAERFPEADELLTGWPGDIAESLRLDARTFVVILSHDARYEDPLWPLLLPSPVRYIGAMGSRKTSAARAKRLTDAGYPSETIGRIHGPVGLDIGARTPAEVAVAILGELTGVRYAAGSVPNTHGLPVRLGKAEYL